MATNKTLDQLTGFANFQPSDLFAVLRPGNPSMQSATWSLILSTLAGVFTSRSNNLSDVANAATALSNLGGVASADPRLMTSGMVVLWSGAANAIPTGWHLCDGTSGTPDLRDRFVMGAGGAHAVGATGGLAVSNITVAGHALAQGELPNYALPVTDPTHAHSVSDPGHTHNFNLVASGTGGSANAQSATGGFVALEDTSTAFTGVGVNASGTGISVASGGSNQAHAHGASQDTNLPPYFALCYIMKT